MRETVLIVFAVAIGMYIRLGGFGWQSLLHAGGLEKVFLITVVCQISLYYCDLYDLRTTSGWSEELPRLLRALATTSLILALIYFWFPTLIIGRGVFLSVSVVVIALLAGSRSIFEWFSRYAAPRERILIVGTTQAAVTLARELFDRRREFGVEIVGFVDPDVDRVGAPVLNPGVIGTLEDIPSIVRARGVDRVVVSLADARGKLPVEKLLEMKLARGITFDHLSTVYEQYTGKIAIENLRPSLLIFSDGFRNTRWSKAVKRASDVVLAATALVVLGPLMLLIAAAVRLTSAGSVLYEQQRVGQYGRVFTMRKFRSMRVDAEATTGAVWAGMNDQRVTAVGQFLRRARLDELPQLWNILRGDMSVVGPRPERPEFVEMLTRKIPFYGERHVIRPGLTGWAQVRYTYGASVEDAMEKLQYDLYYLKNMSLAFDLLVIFETAKTIIQRRGAA
jgi:sugar transferase (PEP-CTERM system associated)